MGFSEFKKFPLQFKFYNVMTRYNLSIALVTRNRPESLIRTLESLSIQNCQPFEILIGDDSNVPDFISTNRKIAEDYGCKYYVSPQKGLYANRNFIAKKCSGSHFRTMDDDHEFPEGHIEKCLEAIEREPETIWTIGEYLSYEKNMTVPCNIPGQLHPRGYSIPPSRKADYFGISCGGTIYPSTLIEKGILNCELYKFGILYLEYGSRLKKLGYKLKFLSTTYLIHHDFQTTASEINREALEEAKLFAVFCLSFKYQPGLINFCSTGFQLSLDLIKAKYSFRTILRAYKNYRNFTKTSIVANTMLSP